MKKSFALESDMAIEDAKRVAVSYIKGDATIEELRDAAYDAIEKKLDADFASLEKKYDDLCNVNRDLRRDVNRLLYRVSELESIPWWKRFFGLK